MGSCLCCFNKIDVSIDIALKLPAGKKYLEFVNDQFIIKNDIDSWIEAIYSKSIYTDYIVYNDESNEKTKSHGGHCKGILAWNKQKISWLIHSVPKFPEAFDGRKISKINESELHFGQSFAHLEIDIENLSEILKNVFSMHPHVHITSNPTLFQEMRAAHRGKINKTRHVNVAKDIVHIAKPTHDEIDIYEHLSNVYGGVWFCQTWRRGNECRDTQKTVNVLNIDFSGTKYSSSRDHSKYASNGTHVFIGDLNRMTTQFHRGGGGVVIKNKKLAHAISKLFL